VKRSVLVVEDDIVALKVLCRQVEDAGFQAVPAQSAEEGLQGKGETRIVITDWELPGMSGVELCQRLRQPQEPLHYLLLLTASQEHYNRATALESGADGFLAKPTTAADIRAHLLLACRILDQESALQKRLEDLVRAENMARQTASLLGQLLDHLPFGIVRYDGEGLVEHLSPSWVKLCRLKTWPSYWVGRRLDELLRESDECCPCDPSFRHILGRAVGNGSPVQGLRFLPNHGGVLDCDLVPTDDMTGGLLLLRDVSAEVESRVLEHRVAGLVQRGLLMPTPPLDVNLDIASFNQASLEVDGDFIDFLHGGEALDVIIGDVMGKGIPAALLGAGTKTQLLRLQIELGPASTPAQFLTRLNQDTLSQFVALNSFVTMFYARFDLRHAQLSFADAGHTKPLYWSRREKTLKRLEGPNTPIGFCPGEEYENFSQNLEVGDAVIFYSDGITEAQNFRGDYLGMARFEDILRPLLEQGCSSQTLVDEVMQQVNSFRGYERSLDDTSLVVVQVRSLPSHHFLLRAENQSSSDMYLLPSLRDFVVQTCKKAGIEANEQWYFELQLVASETISNVIRHSYQGKRDGELKILVRVFSEVVMVRVYHQGIPIPSNRRFPKKIIEPRESGMGLYLMSQLTDQVLYGSDPGGIHWVEFTKKVP
jgi:sigma-B regulation protein RsbU (phosphoserine phosphatase)